jgi:hypothetical protein
MESTKHLRPIRLKKIFCDKLKKEEKLCPLLDDTDNHKFYVEYMLFNKYFKVIFITPRAGTLLNLSALGYCDVMFKYLLNYLIR